ncbi:hypothetical protein, partial [Phyllobacterium zundukense]|uniref:hypothetical protein n=1 Tax=Phyllobacterium zundukense TaxID=1867719 RepID=UPI001A9F90D9
DLAAFVERDLGVGAPKRLIHGDSFVAISHCYRYKVALRNRTHPGTRQKSHNIAYGTEPGYSFKDETISEGATLSGTFDEDTLAIIAATAVGSRGSVS